jgi:hypothetical protein
MTREELAAFARQYLASQGHEVSPSIDSLIATSRSVNPSHFPNLDDDTIRSNAVIVLSETIDEFMGRQRISPTVHKIRDIDLRPAIKRRFCSLPPFCK